MDTAPACAVCMEGKMFDMIAGPVGSADLKSSFDNKQTALDAPPALMTVRELADTFRVSTDTIRRLVERRTISFTKVGGGIRFSQSDVRLYLDQNRIERVA